MEYINNKIQSLPAIGLGTYNLKYNDFLNLLSECLIAGVVYFDLAERYDNEADFGKAMDELNIPRNDIIIATKISNKQQNSCSTLEAIESSLIKLNTDYIDYYFIHSPKYKDFMTTWYDMIRAKERGLIKNIAVSNFSEEQIEKLFEETGIYPSILQTLVNPLYYPKHLIKYCKEKNILVQAYCPLNQMNESVLSNNSLTLLSHKYHKTEAQIMLRFLFQKGILSIPKTASLFHLKENIDIFDFIIDDSDVKLLIGD